MIKINGYYYSGQSPVQISVTVAFHLSGKVVIEGEAVNLITTIEQISIAPRLANTRRSIFLANGAKLETDDNEAVDRVSRYFDKNIFHALLHKLEKNWHYALIALVVTIVFIWGSIEYGVPLVAKWAVKGIPESVEKNIGEQGLSTLDEWLFSPTTIEKKEQLRLQDRFNAMLVNSDNSFSYRVMLRSSKQMGANALALPGGIIIVTDDLIKLAENDEQIFAVLAHEMGHVEYQHGLRSMLQNSLTALFMAGVLGDISSVTSLSVTIPTMLVESRYSREFELEADQYAKQFLQTQNIELDQFIRILSLLEINRNMDDEFDYLSSHPAMNKRVLTLQNER